MSIRPIDMQVLIPKVTEVGIQQNNLAHQGTLQQQQFAEQLEKTVQLRQQQVQGVVKGQGGKVERDDKKEKNNKRYGSDPGQNRNVASAESSESEDSAKESARPDPVLGHIIDIKM